MQDCKEAPPFLKSAPGWRVRYWKRLWTEAMDKLRYDELWLKIMKRVGQ